MGEVVTTIPTIGFIVETVSYKNITFTVWDMGGRGNFRKSLWRHYYPNTDAVIMVIDSNDHERIGNLNAFTPETAGGYFTDSSAAEELYAFLSDELLVNVPLLIFANKQDLPRAMKVDTITDKLGLRTHYKNRKWHIQTASATTGDGLYEGLDWLSNTLNNKTK